MKKASVFFLTALAAILILYYARQTPDLGSVGSINPTDQNDLRSLASTPIPEPHRSTSETGSTQPERITPVALVVAGFPDLGPDPLDSFLREEGQATHNKDSALTAFRMLNSCDSLPSLESVPSEMATEIDLDSAINLCREIQRASSFRTDELVGLASELGSVQATILLPSFPPAFNESDSSNVKGDFLNWQEQTIRKLQDVAESGNADAQLRLARLLSGEFPAFQNKNLAREYVQLALDTGGLSPYQISLGHSLLRKIPD